MDDAYLFQPGREEKVDPLPTVKQQAGDDRVAEEQTDDQKDGSVSDACEDRDPEISEELAPARSVEKIPRGLGREEPEVKYQHRADRRDAEQHDRCDEARQVFADDKDFAPYRREKIVVQTAVDHFAAKQVHENPRTAEEDECAKDERAVDPGIDHAQLAEIFHLVRRG